jgi:peptide/nickel transport system ATP-binding protein
LASGTAEKSSAETTAVAVSIEGLRIEFPGPEGSWLPVVDDISFDLLSGETLGFVGESGSGKTMTALSMVGLIPKPGRLQHGTITLRGRRLDDLDDRGWAKIRGKEVGMVFQDALSGLNPVRSIGSALTEVIRRHTTVSRAEAKDQAIETLRAVGIPSPEERVDSYPHQLSGGMRQRVMIALAIVNHPDVVIADEPTTALDATIQAQILDLLSGLVGDGTLLLITHDLGVAAAICDRIAVIYAGRIVEVGEVHAILNSPTHPYTVGLIEAVPTFERDRRAMVPIPGSPPTPDEVLAGCAFTPRCSRALDRCATDRPPVTDLGDRVVSCWNPHEG